jgi:hypothetical protein
MGGQTRTREGLKSVVDEGERRKGLVKIFDEETLCPDLL